MDGEMGIEGTSQDGVNDDTENLTKEEDNPDIAKPGEVKQDTYSTKGDALPPDTDESEEVKRDTCTTKGDALPPDTDESKEIQRDTKQLVDAPFLPKDQSHGAEGAQFVPEKTKDYHEDEGLNERASSNTPEHAEAVVEQLSILSTSKTNVVNVGPPKDKQMIEPSTSSEVNDQETILQGAHDTSVSSKPETASDDNAESDISKVTAKSDGDEQNEGQINQDESKVSKREERGTSDDILQGAHDASVSLKPETASDDNVESDISTVTAKSDGEEPKKNEGHANQNDSEASKREERGTSDNTVPSERPTKDPQPNDGPGRSPSSGHDAAKNTTATEIPKPGINPKKSEKRPVSVSICTSANEFNVKGLESHLNNLKTQRPELIKEVKIHRLPYNDLDNYRFPPEDPVDVMILCHSIHNRRFAITNVMDAIYDKYLPYCVSVIGKEKMCVIVHDFDDMRDKAQSSRMASFKNRQPMAFSTTSLQVTCGPLENEEQVSKNMQNADKEQLVEFLTNASKHPENMKKRSGSSDRTGDMGKKPRMSDSRSDSNVDTGKDEATKVSDKSLVGAVTTHTQSLSQSHRNVDTYAPPSSRNMTQSHPRPISVSICSSAYELNVKGLMSWFTHLKTKQPHMIADVHFRDLPYNDIDSFTFPQTDPVDVMLLCHSIQNRGFSITDVMNAVYDKYLKYCHDVIGKQKVAVIVHDFTDLKPETIEVKMETFRRLQPSTFKLVDTVILCGNLEEPGKLEMGDKEEGELLIFIERARFQPKENRTVNKKSYFTQFSGFVSNLKS